MITVNTYTRVDFNHDDGKRIEAAVETIDEIIDGLQKTGGDTYTMIDSLTDAASYLRAILDKTIW